MKLTRYLIVASAMLASLAAGAAYAADTIVGPPSSTMANPSPPLGSAVQTNLPLATQAQFTAAEKQAAVSAPTGVWGAIAGNPGGGGDLLSKPFVSAPEAYGTSTAPYTTARAAAWVLGNSSSATNTPVTSYPWRATGKLYFQKPSGGTFVCSASLIKKGVIVTAAHCVHNFGQGAAGWYNSWIFCPANTTSAGGVYGCYNAAAPFIATSYYNGTDTCTQAGVVCNNDIAVLSVLAKNGVYAGNVVGWYGYGWNGYSYRASSFLGNVVTVQITQLGYPVAFDSGYQMQRTDAVGWYFASGNMKNTQIGSAQTGGSSGGPWITNFGTPPSVGAGASLGSFTGLAVVGVTSYGSTTVGFNRQGSSFFGQNIQFPAADYGGYGGGNIGRLVQSSCTGYPAYC